MLNFRSVCPAGGFVQFTQQFHHLNRLHLIDTLIVAYGDPATGRPRTQLHVACAAGFTYFKQKSLETARETQSTGVFRSGNGPGSQPGELIGAIAG